MGKHINQIINIMSVSLWTQISTQNKEPLIYEREQEPVWTGRLEKAS